MEAVCIKMEKHQDVECLHKISDISEHKENCCHQTSEAQILYRTHAEFCSALAFASLSCTFCRCCYFSVGSVRSVRFFSIVSAPTRASAVKISEEQIYRNSERIGISLPSMIHFSLRFFTTLLLSRCWQLQSFNRDFTGLLQFSSEILGDHL